MADSQDSEVKETEITLEINAANNKKHILLWSSRDFDSNDPF